MKSAPDPSDCRISCYAEICTVSTRAANLVVGSTFAARRAATATALEERAATDPSGARAVALRAAALVGVPAELLDAFRSARDESGWSARQWLREMLDADETWRGADGEA